MSCIAPAPYGKVFLICGIERNIPPPGDQVSSTSLAAQVMSWQEAINRHDEAGSVVEGKTFEYINVVEET